MRLVGTTILIIAILACSAFFGLRFFVLGRFLPPTTREYVALARPWRPVVQALYDYKAERGVLPQQLDDLVPAYLPTLPKGESPFYSDNTLSIHANFPHTYVTYSFLKGHEGWRVSGEDIDEPLPLPTQAATRPSPAPGALAAARIGEYDHRLALNPRDSRTHARKIAYLVALGRTTDARAACQTAASAMPDWWLPQMALASLSRADGDTAAEQSFRKWVDQHPAFVHYWYLARYYRDRERHDAALAALWQAVKHPLEGVDRDAHWVPNAFAFDAAKYAYDRGDYPLVLEITRVWASPRGVYTNPGDDLLAFRAAANLATQQYDQAKADADLVAERGKRGNLWAKNLRELQAAAARHDSNFRYDAGDFTNDWKLFPDPN